MLFPKPLKPGNLIAIASPASIVDPRRVEGAVSALEAEGFRVRVMPHALGASGSFAAPEADRVADMVEALTDPEVRAVICSRGGFGCVQLLDPLARLPLAADPKWLVGFSDVTALHALMASKGIVSIHGSMAKALAELPRDAQPNAMLRAMLGGQRPALEFAPGEGSRSGVAVGRLVGGNLAVMQALMRTDFDPFAPGTILFVEDIAEPIYKVERIFHQLRLAGILDRLAGLVLGQFTDYRPDRNHTSVEAMLRRFTDPLSIPVAFGAPVGHIDGNLPLLHGADARLVVTDTKASIEYTQKTTQSIQP